MTTKTKDIDVVFEPVNKSQADFLASKASRLLFSGAFGAGKSIALCAKALKLSLDYPGNFGLIARKVRATLPQTTLKTFFDKVCPQELILDYNKSEGLVKIINGSQILFIGLDDPLKLGSLELGFAGIDEAIETQEDEWKMLEGRLRLPNVPHVIFAATNPGPPSHYLYRMFYQENKGEVYHASALDNPTLPEDYRERLMEFEGIYRDRYVYGLWKGLEGLVYSTFNDKVCLIPRFEIHKSWLVYSGHDFGPSHSAALFYAENPGTGEMFAFAEYAPKEGVGIYEDVQAFKKITEGYNVMKRVGGAHGEELVRQGYSAQGWVLNDPKNNGRMYQIMKVQALHKLNKVYIFNDLTNYVREKFSFAFKKDGNETTDLIVNESRFHCMAAERYILSDFTPETVEKRNKYTTSLSIRRR